MALRDMSTCYLDASPSRSALDCLNTSNNSDSTTITSSSQSDYQYNYGNAYGGLEDPQHRQLHRIWETGPDGELLVNRRSDIYTTATTADTLAESSVGIYIFMDVYLPNGLLLPIQCPAHRTLALLKQDVFMQARKYPLSNKLLHDISNYIFATIGLDGTHVELYDEQKAVSSLQFLFLPLLVLVEPEGNTKEKELNQNIGIVMGITLAELERSIDEELHHYRLRLFETCLFAESQRGTQSFCHYAFPEEPLLFQESAQSTQKPYGTEEIGETDLDYAQFPEQPGEIEKRAMEKLSQKMQFSDAYVEIWYDGSLVSASTNETDVNYDTEQFKYTVRIGNVLGMKTEDVIQSVLRELKRKYNLEIVQQSNDFILQIAGRRIFITRKDVLLTQFNYIRSCFENYRIPRLILRCKKDVFVNYPPPPKIFEPSYMRRERHNQYLKGETAIPTGGGVEQLKLTKDMGSFISTQSTNPITQYRFLWDLDENLRVRILSASNITLQDNAGQIFIRVAVAVGRHVLNIKDSSAVSSSNPRWQEGNIEFDIYMKDLPESAQLCFFLVSVHSNSVSNEYKFNKKGISERQRAKSKIVSDQCYPIGWANIRMFDWQNRLIQGKQTLFLRPFAKDKMKIDYLHANGQIVSIEELNYYGDVSITLAKGRTTRLEIEMPEYFGHSVFIEYPSDSVIQRYVSWLKSQKSRQLQIQSVCETDVVNQYDEYNCIEKAPKLMPGNPDLERLLLLRRCLDSAEFKESDQKFLWSLRYKIQCLFPQMLPVLADCSFIWRERETISEFYHLLIDWPPLQVDTAIELLDGRYLDRRLRMMAVQHLNNALNDDQLQLYLLILMQAIRFEAHAYSPLAQMLLTRALMDYRVGHTLFWLLRAELAHLLAINQNQSINNCAGSSFPPLFFRFAFLLEAYCRGNSAHLQSMIKQVEMISILVTLSSCICASGNKDTANKKLQQELLLRKGQMQHMVSPVNATDQLGELLIEECRVLGSAKQPLLLTWRNPESLAELTTPTHQLIFKCGDDLRQDMLTLHVMRIMDAKWKSQLQQDYCMTLYEVLPMGKNIGLIHVVPDCQTLFQIQCEEKRTATMDLTLLNKYIYKRCCGGDSKKYLECVDRFTFSLAGYCVATYILGIKDRHQDNIMLAKDGRIFHIDFGHFLGHTKRKLGINREWTDFVLTDHFLYVISRGKSNFRQTYEYTSFREECIKGFLVLHNQARFFIALFRMMSSMGLPELSSASHIDFLCQSLMYDKVERGKAKAAFEQIFEEVVKGDWSVHLNWFFHSVKHM